MKKLLLLSILMGFSLACATLTAPFQDNSTPYPTFSSQPTIAPTQSNGDISRMQNVDVYCPSDVADASNAYNRAITQETAGDFEGAEQSYREAIDLDPKYCDAMDNLAILLKKNGKVDEAIALYQQSIKVKPDNDVAHLGLANAYASQERYDEALGEYSALAQIDPGNPEGYYGAGIVYFDNERYTEAIVQFEQAETIYKQQNSDYVMDAQAYLGFSHTLLGEYETGRDYLEPIYPSYANNSYFNYLLGVCYYYGESIKDDALAKQYLTRAGDLGYDLEPELDSFISQP